MERRLVELRETTKIVRGAAAGFSSGLVFNLMSFGFYLAIVRLLPTDSLGVFYTLQLVMGFITTFGLLSLPSGVNRFVTGFVQTNRLEEARYLFRKGLTMAFLISIISLPVLVLLSSYLSYWFLGTTKYSLLFDLIAFDFVLIAFNSFFGVSLYAYRRFGRLGALQVAYGGFRYGGGVLFILLGLQVKAIILGWITSDLFRTFTYAYYSHPLLFGASLKNDLKKVFSFSLPYVIANGIVVALQNVDSLFVLKYLGVNALGVYGTLLNVSSIPQILPTSIGGSLMPAILKIEDSKGLSANVITNAIRYIALIVLPVFSLAAATGKPLIHIFFGRKICYRLGILCGFANWVWRYEFGYTSKPSSCSKKENQDSRVSTGCKQWCSCATRGATYSSLLSYWRRTRLRSCKSDRISCNRPPCLQNGVTQSGHKKLCKDTSNECISDTFRVTG